MKVRVFINPHMRHHPVRTGWMVEGLRRHGICDIDVVHGDNPVPCDMALFWSGKFPQVMAAQIQAGKHYLMMEDPVWGKVNGARMMWDGYHGEGDWCGAGDADRSWVHGYDMKPWRPDGDGPVVIFGQVQNDHAASDATLDLWYRGMIDTYRKLTDRPITFRPHPSRHFSGGPDDIEWDERPVDDVLAEASIAVTWTTTAACDAICAGVPALTFHRKSLAFDLTAHEPTLSPPTPDRESWFDGLGYIEWTQAEIISGLAWDHLVSKIAAGGSRKHAAAANRNGD